MEVKKLVYDVVQNGAAIAIVEALNLHDMIKSDNKYVNYMKAGAIWTAADQGVDYFNNKTNDVVQMNYKKLGDQLGYNSLVYAAIDMSGAGAYASNVLANTLPFDSRITTALTNGAIKLGVRLGSNIINNSYQNTPLYTASHLVTSFVR